MLPHAERCPRPLRASGCCSTAGAGSMATHRRPRFESDDLVPRHCTALARPDASSRRLRHGAVPSQVRAARTLAAETGCRHGQGSEASQRSPWVHRSAEHPPEVPTRGRVLYRAQGNVCRWWFGTGAMREGGGGHGMEAEQPAGLGMAALPSVSCSSSPTSNEKMFAEPESAVRCIHTTYFF